jgi:RHS repeat-associated protein
MAYNALGQRTQLARFQSTGSTNPVATTDYTYDTANRLSGIAHKQGTTNLNTYAYTYDPLSRLKTVTSTLDGLTNYTYSQNDQLLGAVNTGVPNESFGYDANGNRNMAGYTTSSDNRMTASPGFTYVYDAEGNLTRRTNTTTGNYTTYTWDHRNRLTQVTERTSLNSLVSEINYEYDAFNRLSRRYPTGGWSTYWVYDEGINPVLEYDSSASPSMTHRYLWSDNVDELLADEQNPGLSSKNTLWALSDHLGSIRDIADRNETTGITSIANHRRYDSTGKRISETNASVDMVFGYTGKLLDETTGLQNNLNRWLDPATGRWISQDPIGFAAGDANLYRYVGNSPTNFVDPTGLYGDEWWNDGGLDDWTLGWGASFGNWIMGSSDIIGIQALSDLQNNVDRTSARKAQSIEAQLDPRFGLGRTCPSESAGMMSGQSQGLRDAEPAIQMLAEKSLEWTSTGPSLASASGMGGFAHGPSGGPGKPSSGGTPKPSASSPSTPPSSAAPVNGLVVRQGNIVVEAGARVSASEAHVGRVFANHGYDVTHKVTASAQGIQGTRTADLVVNGVGRVDVFTPKAVNSTSIARAIESKGTQAPVVAVSGNVSNQIMQETARRMWGKTTASAKAIQQIVFEHNGVLTWFTRPQ